ncbi:hypothetical protein IWX50DRAFT_74403 [Phyllosticta citricarpa]
MLRAATGAHDVQIACRVAALARSLSLSSPPFPSSSFSPHAYPWGKGVHCSTAPQPPTYLPTCTRPYLQHHRQVSSQTEHAKPSRFILDFRPSPPPAFPPFHPKQTHAPLRPQSRTCSPPPLVRRPRPVPNYGKLPRHPASCDTDGCYQLATRHGHKKVASATSACPEPGCCLFFFFFFFFGTTTTCPNTTTTAIPTTVHRHLLHSTSVQIPHQPTNLTPISPSPTTPLLTRSHLSPLTYLPPLVPTLPLKIHLPSPSSHGRRRRSSHHIHIVYRIPSPKPRNILAPITQLERLQTTCTVPCESAPAAAISTISVWLALRTWSRWLRHSGQAGNAACHSRAKLRREEAAR